MLPPISESFVAMPSKMRPIIKASAFEIGVIDFKTHFADKMQLAVRRDTSAPDVSCVLRNLGLN